MSISYEEALATLEGMFGENWSREQLDAVLRNKQGHMENTVDLILSHGDRSPQILIDKLSRGEDPNAERINADEELARSLANGNRNPGQGRGGGGATGGGAPAPAPATSQKGQRGTPTNLPSDFLRIPTHSTTTSTDQMESDEALARMLQDKMFSEEISRNPDFAHLARGRNGGVPASSQRIRTSQATASNRARSTNQPPDLDIMKSLGELGKSARSKLQMMAAQFNAKTRGSATNGSANAGVASANGGHGTVGERRGLLDDDDNDEDVALEFATRKDL